MSTVVPMSDVGTVPLKLIGWPLVAEPVALTVMPSASYQTRLPRLSGVAAGTGAAGADVVEVVEVVDVVDVVEVVVGVVEVSVPVPPNPVLPVPLPEPPPLWGRLATATAGATSIAQPREASASVRRGMRQVTAGLRRFGWLWYRLSAYEVS
jgi:hypothetical protein